MASYLALPCSSIIVLYSVLGVLADAFIGRYRLLQFSLWVQWITAIVSTFIISLSDSESYHMHEKLIMVFGLLDCNCHINNWSFFISSCGHTVGH